jgi:hypothetical protein
MAESVSTMQLDVQRGVHAKPKVAGMELERADYWSKLLWLENWRPAVNYCFCGSWTYYTALGYHSLFGRIRAYCEG